MKNNLRICIVGDDGVGKSEVAKMFGTIFRVGETSEIAANAFFNAYRFKYSYATVNEAWLDRVNHRDEWKDFIRDDINGKNPTALIEAAYEHVNVLSGVRHLEEFLPAKEKGLFNYVIYVEGPCRKDTDVENSNEITPDLATMRISNYTHLSDLLRAVRSTVSTIMMLEYGKQKSE